MDNFKTIVGNILSDENVVWYCKDEGTYGKKAKKLFNNGINIHDFIPFTENSLQALLKIFDELDEDIDNVIAEILRDPKNSLTNIKKSKISAIKKEYRKDAIRHLLEVNFKTDMIVHRQLVNALHCLIQKIDESYYGKNKHSEKTITHEKIKNIITTLQDDDKENYYIHDYQYLSNKKPIDTINNYLELNPHIKESKSFHPHIDIENAADKNFFVAIARRRKDHHAYIIVGYKNKSASSNDSNVHILASIGKQFVTNKTKLEGTFGTHDSTIQNEGLIKKNGYKEAAPAQKQKIDYKAYGISYDDYVNFIRTFEFNKLPTGNGSGKPAYYVPIKNQKTETETEAKSTTSLVYSLDLFYPSNKILSLLSSEPSTDIKGSSICFKDNDKALTKLNYLRNSCQQGAVHILGAMFNIVDPSLSPHFWGHLPDTFEYKNGKIIGDLNIHCRPYFPTLKKSANTQENMEECMQAIQLIWDCMTEIRYTTYDKIIRNKKTTTTNNTDDSTKSLKNQKLAKWGSLYNEIIDYMKEPIESTEERTKLHTIIDDWKTQNTELLATRRQLSLFPFKTRSIRYMEQLEEIAKRSQPAGEAASTTVSPIISPTIGE